MFLDSQSLSQLIPLHTNSVSPLRALLFSLGYITTGCAMSGLLYFSFYCQNSKWGGWSKRKLTRSN